MITKNKGDALEQMSVQLIEPNSVNDVSPNIWNMDSNTNDNVQQSWKDDRHAFQCGIIKYALVTAITLTYLSHKLSGYNDPSLNSVTRTTVEPIQYLPVPYILMFPQTSIDHISIQNITIYGGEKAALYYLIVEKHIVSGTDKFQYNKSRSCYKGWEMHVLSDWSQSLLLIPPCGTMLAPSKWLRFNVTSRANCKCFHWTQVFCENSTELGLAYNKSLKADSHGWTPFDELKLRYMRLHELEGDSYGFYWTIGSVASLEGMSYEDIYKPYTSMETKLYYHINNPSLEYAAVASRTRSVFSLTEMHNDWDSTTEEVYELTSSGGLSKIHSLMNIAPIVNFAIYDSNTGGKFAAWTRDGCWYFQNDMFFTIDPHKGGVKTVITVSRQRSIADIFSATGGIFSPVLKGLTIFFAYLLSVKIAKKQGWSATEKLKAALYLQELGLITDQKHQDSTQFKRMNKKHSKKCLNK